MTNDYPMANPIPYEAGEYIKPNGCDYSISILLCSQTHKELGTCSVSCSKKKRNGERLKKKKRKRRK